MRAVFQYGIIHGACDRDPAADIDSATALKGAPVTHQARVSQLKLPQLLLDVDAYQSDAVTRLALQFMTLTFARTTEMIQVGDKLGAGCFSFAGPVIRRGFVSMVGSS